MSGTVTYKNTVSYLYALESFGLIDENARNIAISCILPRCHYAQRGSESVYIW